MPSQLRPSLLQSRNAVTVVDKGDYRASVLEIASLSPSSVLAPSTPITPSDRRSWGQRSSSRMIGGTRIAAAARDRRRKCVRRHESDARGREGAVQATLHVATFVMGPTRGGGRTRGRAGGRTAITATRLAATDTDRPTDATERGRGRHGGQSR